jgi:hypothetical protein
MPRKRLLPLNLCLLLVMATSAIAQQIPPPRPYAPAPSPTMPGSESEAQPPIADPALDAPSPVPPGTFVTSPVQAVAAPVEEPPGLQAASGLEPESLPGELTEDISQAASTLRLGATPVSQVQILGGFFRGFAGPDNWFTENGIRTFGWVEGGYTGASTGSGLLAVEPRQNRFGDNFLLNQIGFALQKPLKQDRFDIGFNIRYFAGADAALGAAKGGIGADPSNPRFGQDFRDLYIDAHLPILTEGGVDVKFGRMNTIIGYNGFLAPYRPFYSSDYQFFYSQDGAFTGFLTDWHVNSRLDFWSGMTLGANTFFTLRSHNSYCYICQMNYWLTDDHKTRLTASVYCGPNAIFAAPGMAGTYDTTVELRVQQNWNQKFTQVVQNNMGWDPNTPVGTGQWYGLYLINIYHWIPTIDLNSRIEWFDDVNGTRTGVATDYSAVTLGLNWHPTRWLEVRPEIRGDFAAAPAFGVGGAHTAYSQLTGGISALLKF